MATTKTPAAKDTNGESERNRKERDEAGSAGLTVVQMRVLNAVAKAGPDGITYRGIEAKTGYYSVLTRVLRSKAGGFRGAEGKTHEDSLGSKGLVKEQIHDVDGKDVLHFVATAKGRKLVSTK